MGKDSQARTIMFADIAGSSRLYKELGNQGAKDCIDNCLATMATAIEAHGGVVVKTIGDEIMARFDSACDAADCAQSLQYDCSHHPESPQLRIGMAYGDTLLDQSDVFGDTVNDASFVVDIARAQQIVITQALFDALTGQQVHCQEFDRVQLKGASDKSLIYRLHWESPTLSHQATTVMSIQELTSQLEANRLTLWLDGEQHSVLPDNTPFIIGRDRAKSNLHINSELASRDHCHIVFQRGKFVLVDHSTNGTYVSTADEDDIYLRRAEIPLTGEGIITIGQPQKQEDQHQIHYSA